MLTEMLRSSSREYSHELREQRARGQSWEAMGARVGDCLSGASGSG